MMLEPTAPLWGREEIPRLERRGRREGEDVHPGSLLNTRGINPAAGHVHGFNRELFVLTLQPCLSLDPGDIPSLDKE